MDKSLETGHYKATLVGNPVITSSTVEFLIRHDRFKVYPMTIREESCLDCPYSKQLKTLV